MKFGDFLLMDHPEVITDLVIRHSMMTQLSRLHCTQRQAVSMPINECTGATSRGIGTIVLVNGTRVLVSISVPGYSPDTRVPASTQC